MSNQDSVIDRLATLVAEARSLPVDETKGRLLELLQGYFQATVALGGSFPIGHGHATIFRGRVTTQKPQALADVSYPPPNTTQQGRCNRRGRPLFYGSFSVHPIAYELHIKEGELLYLSRWTTFPGRWLSVNYVGLSKQAFDRLRSTREPPYWARPEVIQELTDRNLALNGKLGDLFVSRDPSDYNFTNAVTEIFTSGNVDALIYPTVALNGSFDDVVIKPQYVDRWLNLHRVDQVIVTGIQSGKNPSFQVLDSATLNEGHNLCWHGHPDPQGFAKAPPMCMMLCNPGQWSPARDSS